jgi:hypothetical protein
MARFYHFHLGGSPNRRVGNRIKSRIAASGMADPLTSWVSLSMLAASKFFANMPLAERSYQMADESRGRGTAILHAKQLERIILGFDR